MEAYLDNSATTQCSQEAADLMMRLLRVDYGLSLIHISEPRDTR